MTDRRTDRQTDESFIGRCPTNVERPKRNINDVSDLHNNANNDPATCNSTNTLCLLDNGFF